MASRAVASSVGCSDPMAITLEEAVALINDKRQAEVERHLRKFEEEPELEVLKGRFGPYIAYKGNNYKLPMVPDGSTSRQPEARLWLSAKRTKKLDGR